MATTFPVLELEAKVQISEKTRLSALKTYMTPDALPVSLVRIKPLASGSFITVSTSTDQSTWYLDWQYIAAATETVTLEITNGTGMTAVITTSTATISIVSSTTEKLFSTDQDISIQDAQALELVKNGKSSLNNYHRFAQVQILDEIYRRGIKDDSGNKLTIDDVVDTAELNNWSKFMVLRLVYYDASNKKDDIFIQKAQDYEKRENIASELTLNNLRIDYNNDGVLDSSDQRNLRSGSLTRRLN